MCDAPSIVTLEDTGPDRRYEIAKDLLVGVVSTVSGKQLLTTTEIVEKYVPTAVMIADALIAELDEDPQS